MQGLLGRRQFLPVPQGLLRAVLPVLRRGIRSGSPRTRPDYGHALFDHRRQSELQYAFHQRHHLHARDLLRDLGLNGRRELRQAFRHREAALEPDHAAEPLHEGHPGVLEPAFAHRQLQHLRH